ncbi:MAG: hypothetical protein AAFN65_16145, partial [Bacteroidota bacterium]
MSDAPGENVSIIEDNCPPSSIVGDPLAIFTCDDLGVNEFNGVTRTDESGNESEPCDFTVTILDTIAPLVFGNDTILYLDEMGMASLTIDEVAQDTVENCTVVDAELFLGDTLSQMATLIDGTSAGRTHSSNGVDPRTTAGSRSSGIRGLHRMPTSSRELLQSELRDDNLMSGGFAPALPQTLFFNCDDSGNIYEVLIVATDQSGNM